MMFKGNYSSSIQENHQFFCDQSLEFNKTSNGDVKSAVTILKQLGLISFTKLSCKQIFDSNIKYIKNTSLYSRLPESLRGTTGMPNGATLIEYNFLTASYTEFNKSASRFNDVATSIDLSTVYQLINYNEARQFDNNYPKNKTLEDQLIAINNSLEKAIIIRVNLFNIERIDFKLILHIRNIQDTSDPVFKNQTTRSNQRSLALNDITIASVPQTPYGQQYSYSNTANHQSQSTSNVGSLLPANPNNKFAQDKVAGKLQTFYDPNTNTFKAGNPQMLARLLTDIDPAPLQSLPTGNLQDIAVSELIEMVSPFTTGKALPLSPQQSNPSTFGPDYIECGNKKIVEITVVNRSLRRFTRDQVVMLTEINGEWIVQDFGKDAELGGGTKFGDWHFIKMIANTDSYFKDDRFYETGNFANPITPSEYEAQSRLKFYNNKLTSLTNDQTLNIIYGSKLSEIVNLNRPQGSPTVSLVPSKRYYIASIFDQLAPEACGFNDLSYLLATNVEDAAVFGDKNLLFKYAQEVPGFWGPVYSDGHSSVGFNPNGRDNSNKTFFDVSKATPSVLNNITLLKDYFPQYNGNYKLHFPAECSSTFINPRAIFNNWNNLGTTPINGSGSSIQSPFYGTSVPATKNRIQFSPLQAELAGSDDLLSTKAKDYSRQFYNIIRAVLSSKLGEGYETIKSLFGDTDGYNMYKRSIELLGYPDNEFLITDVSKCGSPAYDNAQQSFTEIANFKSIKYDCFVNRSNSNSGLVGSPALFRKSGGTDGANCVGIISAKQTITKRSGGKLNYSINQDFGLNQQRASTLATNFITIIPGIFSGGGSAGGGMQYGFPQWGSTTDNINSFGTTALHLRIFDYWPEIDTVFDPRYFGILHFNPNDESVDISIPTLDNSPAPQPPNPLTNTLRLGTVITSTTKLLSKSAWVKSYIRRGMLLTGGGFKYFAHQIGLKDDSGSVVSGGAGFTSNFEYEIKNKNVILLLTVSGNTVTGVSIKDGSSIRHHTTRGIDNKYRGINFLPSDFDMNVPKFTNGELDGTTGEKAFIVSIPPQVPGQTSKAAIIKFTSGEVYFEEKIDLPPTEQVPLTRLTSSSKRGEDFVQSIIESDFTLESNKSGKYDCFYHFHNDITHTLMTDQPFVAGFLQYVTMTIT